MEVEGVSLEIYVNVNPKIVREIIQKGSTPKIDMKVCCSVNRAMMGNVALMIISKQNDNSVNFKITKD
jgi:hypothetical protein